VSFVSVYNERGLKLMRRVIYCPLCLKKGKKKLLAKVDCNAKGTLYLWCKEDKKEIQIDLEPMSQSERT